jgi:hypothetical protein
VEQDAGTRRGGDAGQKAVAVQAPTGDAPTRYHALATRRRGYLGMVLLTFGGIAFFQVERYGLLDVGGEGLVVDVFEACQFDVAHLFTGSL